MFSVGVLEPGEKLYPKYTACDVFCRGPGTRRRRANLNICVVSVGALEPGGEELP
jgi:hypothetical protein